MHTVAESAPYTTECIECRASAAATVAEVLADGKHEWDLHGTCGNCGSEWYECGFEPPPTSIRSAILTANGPSILELEIGSATPTAVMGVLRRLRSLSLAQARAMADELLGTGLKGTLVEMESLAQPLRVAGAIVSVRPSKYER